MFSLKFCKKIILQKLKLKLQGRYEPISHTEKKVRLMLNHVQLARCLHSELLIHSFVDTRSQKKEQVGEQVRKTFAQVTSGSAKTKKKRRPIVTV